MHALGLEFGSATRLSKRPGSLWNCLWGLALKRSPGINRKSRVLYPGTGFLSSTTWPSLPKKHHNGLFNQSISLYLPPSIDVTVDMLCVCVCIAEPVASHTLSLPFLAQFPFQCMVQQYMKCWNSLLR